MLFPSLTETFGNVTLEAMASGLAVVAYDDAAARVLIRDKENGLLAARSDAGDFISCAVYAVTKRGVRAHCGMRAVRTAAAQSWDAVGELFENALWEIVERNHPSR
ncbi:MAG: glycosyltransferase [Vicinamibacteria bacterium]|nr:glycosyltransferase [Vicinamibacteria bacterium]